MREKIVRKLTSVRRRIKQLPFWEAQLVPPVMIIMFANFSSRAVGLLRESIFATRFGAPAELDAYAVAFQLPDLLTRLFVLGAFSAAFIPVFARFIELGEDQKAWKLADVITTLLFGLLTVLALFLLIFAPFIVPFLAPGFDLERQQFTVLFLRIMLLSPILLGISNVFSGVLNSHHKFVAAAFAPLFYNLGIIIGSVFFAPRIGLVWGLGLGVVLGAFLHALVQFFPAMNIGFRWRFSTDIKAEGVKEVAVLAGPRIVGMGVTQLDMFVDVILGSFLPVGSIILLNYANRLQTLPVGIFGAAIATAVFPTFVKRMAKKDIKGFNEALFTSLKHVLYFTVPLTIFFIIMRVEIVRLLFGQSGKLGWFETRSVAFALALYSISIFAQAAIYVLNRAFYAMLDTKTPVVASLISVCLNSLLSVILVLTVHHFAMLALSYTIASLVNMLMLLVFLYAKIGTFRVGRFPRDVLAIVLAAAAMGTVLLGVEYYLSNFVFELKLVRDVLLETLICVGVSAMIYIAIAELLGCRQISTYAGRWKRHGSKHA